MPQPLPRVWFDFVDPLSYLLDLESPRGVEWAGLELVPPPAPLGTIDDPFWAERLEAARRPAHMSGVVLEPPTLVPWTRKAHELHLHAREHGKGDEVRRAIFVAYFERGEDIGRIDRLVGIAASVGLDASAARTVLGVDRHEEDVALARAAAAAAGVDDVPTIEVSGRLVRGFHNREDLGTLLGP
jgi:predicted DsbA family dithiol-disulfide isomerase